jgi:AbrB family looped-hinge helix DNA binding protein
MNSTITSKYQTTIPKDVRERLGLAVHDTLEWVVEKGKVTVYPLQKNFLQYRNSVKVGKGEIGEDIERARMARLEKYR